MDYQYAHFDSEILLVIFLSFPLGEKDASGFYSLPVTAETYELTASLEPVYYTNSSVTATVVSGVVVQDIELGRSTTEDTEITESYFSSL